MFTNVTAQKIAHELFDCYGTTTGLPGECDHNFHLKTEQGMEYLLKISHLGEDPASVDLQNEVLLKLQAAKLPFTTPTPQRTIHNQWVGQFAASQRDAHFVRLFTYVPGQLFARAHPHDRQLLKSLGHQLGHLSRSLCDFKHPDASRYSKWDLKQASWIQSHLNVIDNDEDRQRVRHCINHFITETEPRLTSLRHSVIHGDINDYNILVTQGDNGAAQVSGIIDFGDVVETSTICELAIAVTYAIMDNPDPLKAASLIIGEYHKIFPLELEEMNLLFELILIRLCTSVINSALRKKEDPHNNYLVISERPAWDLFRVLQDVNADVARSMFRSVCGVGEC